MKKINSCLLLLCMVAVAFTSKTEFPAKLQQQLSIYYRYHAPPKIYVDLNQPKYSPGDTAFFKTYLLTPTGQLQTNGKHVINVMLVNAEQQGILRNKTFIQDGKGSSQFIIPLNMPGGNYSLVAYIDGGGAGKVTPSAYFQRSFIITEEKVLKDEKNTAALQFFAEGGALIEGLPNTMAVSGLNTSDEAWLSADGTRIASFRALANGFGRFSFTPEANKQYTVEYSGNRFPLDPPKQDGVVMTVSGNSAEKLKAALQVKDNSAMRDAELYLVMNMHDQICFVAPVSFRRNTTVSVSLNNKLCAFGTAQLTLFTSEGVVLAERVLFLEPSKPEIELQFDKEQYHPREKVKVGIMLSSEDHQVLTGNASVTVYRDDFFRDAKISAGFFNHVFFDSDLSMPQGLLPSVADSAQNLNDLLIAARWNKITWQELLNLGNGIPKPSSPIFLKGRVTDEHGKPVRDSTMITFWLNQNDFIYGVYTRNSGEFYFPLFKNFGDDQALYAVTFRNTVIKNARLTVEEPSVVIGNTSVKVKSTENDVYHAFTKVKVPILKSFTYYGKKRAEGSGEETAANDMSEDYIETDFTVDVGRYKEFTTVAEILGEAVTMVKPKKVQGKDDIRVFITGTSMFASGSPLLVIDGMLTDSIDYLMTMNPSQIRSIGVIHDRNSLVRYGILGKNGILVITTSAPELHQEQLRGKGTLNIKGIDPSLRFKTRQYHDQSDKRVPDLRSTLHWEPGINISSTKDTPLEFFTADGTGTYTVKISGITQNGIPFERYRYFKVVR